MSDINKIRLGYRPRTGKYFNCQVCSKECYVKPSQGQTAKYCSYACKSSSQERKTILNCANCSLQYSRPQSQVKWAKIRGYKNSFCSPLCATTFNRTSPARDKRNYQPQYNLAVRRSKSFTDWRNVVFQRDDYTCQICSSRNGNGHSIKLHAHHMKRFCTHPDLRFVPSNGKTLCEQCHRDLHLHFSCSVQDFDGLIWVKNVL